MRAALPLALLAATLTAIGASSEAEKFVPKDFDTSNSYKTYSIEEFQFLVDKTGGINNPFVGQNVKVFSTFDVQAATGSFNRTRRAVLPNFGICHLDLCDSMEPIVSPSAIEQVRNALGPHVAVYFPDQSTYRTFLQDTDRLCTYAYPCRIWVKGRAEYVETEVRVAFGTRKLRIAYIVPDEVRLYEGHQNAIAEGTLTGLAVASKVYSFLRKTN